MIGLLAVMLASLAASAVRLAAQWERAIVLRLGQFHAERGPGLFFVIPVIESVPYVLDMRTITTVFKAEQTMTKDTVPVDVDAVLFWRVVNPQKATLEVANYQNAVSWASQTALRDIIGRSTLAELLSDREAIDARLRTVIDQRTEPWGMRVESVEIREVEIPQELQDSMARQAQAERERQARVILGESETQIAEKFQQAAKFYADNPTALHLRAMNMLYESLRDRGAVVIVPSSAVETMNLGAVGGLVNTLGMVDSGPAVGAKPQAAESHAAPKEPQEPPPGRNSRYGLDLINPHPDCLAEITSEYPYLQYRYELFREEMLDEGSIDRRRVQYELLKEAERSYEKATGEKIAHWQRLLVARFSRNLALSSGELAPSLFDLTTAARSVVDDNYGWDVWETGGRYPPQRADSDLLTENLTGEQIWRNTRRIRLRRRLPTRKQRLRPAGLKPRKKEKTPGEWAHQLDGNAICSYPPEDIVIEGYGRFLQKKAKSILSEERMHTEPFTASVLDGIDLRETIRHWHENQIYVRQLDKVAGEVGSVIVIFDEDREDRYPWLTTWLGEHANESDMAFYSTNPFEKLVGPGIGRAEYGGFLMSLPPRRMIDVWTDPDYDLAQSKPERLLLAGLDYSIHRHVVYVAAKPPRSIYRSIAARLGRSILYVPIGALDPAKLKKIRVVHVLDSHARRAEAKQYIW
ncbi:MAG: slipin family protein [Bryobacteraceae bacterium]|nr:slipin family protein [Bryobacteraceae bacterium]